MCFPNERDSVDIRDVDIVSGIVSIFFHPVCNDCIEFVSFRDAYICHGISRGYGPYQATHCPRTESHNVDRVLYPESVNQGDKDYFCVLILDIHTFHAVRCKCLETNDAGAVGKEHFASVCFDSSI